MALLKLSVLAFILVLGLSFEETTGYRLAQDADSYHWQPCTPFEATKKNCPRGEACLKPNYFTRFAWNRGLICQSREEFIGRNEYVSGLI